MRATDRSQVSVAQQSGELASAWGVDTLEEPVVPVGGQTERFIRINLGREITNGDPNREVFINNQHDPDACSVVERVAARQRRI